jgi:hypothetical protein
MNARANRRVIAAAIAALILGAIFSPVIERGVRVEKVMLTTNNPRFDFPPQRRVRIRLRCSLMEPPARKKCSVVSARRSLPLVLIATRWIRRDMENRRNVAPSGMSMESGDGPPTSCYPRDQDRRCRHYDAPSLAVGIGAKAIKRRSESFFSTTSERRKPETAFPGELLHVLDRHRFPWHHRANRSAT